MKFLERIGGNRSVLAISAARLGDAVGNSILFVVLPLYVAALPSPLLPFSEPVRVGILLSLYGLAMGLLQPLVAAISDRLGKRKAVIQVGLVLMTGATLLFLVAENYVELLAMRLVQGVAVAMVIPASMALMASGTEERTRGGSMGIYTTLRMVGFAIGPVLGGYLHSRFGFGPEFYVGAAFTLLGFIAVQLWVHDDPAEARRAREHPRPLKVLDRDLLTAPLLGTGFAVFVMAVCFTLMVTLERQFNRRLEETAFGFSLAFSALIVSRLIFQIPLGSLSDRIGRKGIVIAGLILMAPSTAFLGVTTSTLQLAGVRFVQGLASAGIAAPAFAIAADLARREREKGIGRQVSLVTMGFGLGIGVGPLLAGLLAEEFFELPFLVGGALCLLAAAVVFRYVPETLDTNEP